MRRIIGHRYVVLTLLGLAVVYYATGEQDAGSGALICAAVIWLIGGRQALFRWRRRAASSSQRIVKIAVRAPAGPRESNSDGCYGRLDPAWRTWLSADAMQNSKEAIDER